MKLHIGCGGVHLDGYVNIDMIKTKAVDVVASATDLPYEDGSVEEIYSSHMIEHLEKKDGIKFVKECSRLLMKGGLLRLELPIVEMVFERFQEDLLINALYGLQRHPGDYHKYGYSKNSISKLLGNYGFNINKITQGRTGYGPESPGVKIWAEKL